MANTTFIVKLYNGRRGIVEVGENGSFVLSGSKFNHLRAICAMAPTESALDFFIKLNINDLEDPRDDLELRTGQIKSMLFEDEEVQEIHELQGGFVRSENKGKLRIIEDEFGPEDVAETVLRT